MYASRLKARADPAKYVIVVGEMRLAVLAAVDARRGRVEVDIIRESHGDGQAIRLVDRGLLGRGTCVETLAVIRAVVRSGHSLLVAACHTCCWRGCEGNKGGGKLAVKRLKGPRFMAPAVAPKRGYYLGMWSEALDLAWGDAAVPVPDGTCVLERDDEGEGHYRVNRGWCVTWTLRWLVYSTHVSTRHGLRVCRSR
jgi:hypothetical protein